VNSPTRQGMFACLLALVLGGSCGANAAALMQFQAPDALSIGTNTNLAKACETLLLAFNAVASRHSPVGQAPSPGPSQLAITLSDLRYAAINPRLVFADGLHEARNFFLVSVASRQLASADQVHLGSDAGMTRSGLTQECRMAAHGAVTQALLNMASRSATAQDRQQFYSVLLKDPGLPAATRDGLLAGFTDAEVADFLGPLVVQGSTQDVASVTVALVALARKSWLEALKYEALVGYRVPIVVRRGAADTGTPLWDGKTLTLSGKMLDRVSPSTSTRPGREWEQVSWAGALPLYDLAQMNSAVASDLRTMGVATDATQLALLDSALTQSVADVFSTRMHVALFGMGEDRSNDQILPLGSAFEYRLKLDPSFWRIQGLRYFVDQTLAQALVPALQASLGLLGDPQFPVMSGS
jgi:hypothetical protein